MKSGNRFWGVFLRFVVLVSLMVNASACHRGAKSGPMSGPTAPVYYEKQSLTDYILETDSPQRKAAMRLMDQALKNPRPRDLIHDLEGALRMDPQNPYTYYYLGWANLQTQQFAQAEVHARKAEQLFRDDALWQAKALVVQAKARIGLAQPERAKQLYEKAHVLDPQNPLIDEGLNALTSDKRIR